jgi:peroxiredoxin
VEKVRFLPDGSGHFTRRMGMLVDKNHQGFGYRGWRYAMVVGDGVVEKWFEEPGSTTPARTTTPTARPAPRPCSPTCAVASPWPLNSGRGK